MRSLVRASVWLVLLLLCPAFALAQPVPPVPQGSTDVPYPAGAQGDGSVVLELVVEADGAVSQVEVVEGTEPFTEPARRAALSWRFSPALRDGVPVAAKVRARVDFHQEVAAVARPVAPRPAASTSPVSPAPEAPLELVVLGERREVGQTTLTAGEVRQMPGAFGDPFRAIEPLPGVTPYVSGIPYFYVRGAPPNDNGYYVDGVRVPLLFHVGLAEGVIHPGLIERVDFFASAAPARYGGFVGAVIDGKTREPAPHFRGEANLRLIDAGALLEAPFAGDRGSALVAGRYGYPGLVLSAISPDLKLDYWDYQARATWRVGERGRLGVFAFGSYDYLATGGEGTSGELVEQFVSDFHRLDLRYDHGTDRGNVRVAVTGGYDAQGANPTYISDRLLGARLEVDEELSPALRIRGGGEAELDHYGFERKALADPTRPNPPSGADPPPTNVTAAAHLDLVWRPAPRLEFVPGVRTGLFRSTRAAPSGGQSSSMSALAVDPRLAARIAMTESLALLSAFGVSHQYPTLRVGDISALLVSVPGFPQGSNQLQRVVQGSLGVEFKLPAGIVASATGFLSRFWGLTDLTAQCFELTPGMVVTDGSEPSFPWVCPNDAPVGGRAYGLELLLRRSLTERLGGLVSYTLSRSTREAHFVTASGAHAVAVVPSENDRRHVLNALLGYDLGRRWRAGGRFVYLSGNPYSKTDGTIPLPPYNSERYGAFYRVDVRLEKSWPFGENGSIAFVFEAQNVTLNKQSAGVNCEGDLIQMGSTLTSTTSCSPAMIGPLTIPSVGVEAFF